MNVPVCERCPTPLKPRQGRFCSVQCANSTGRTFDRRCARAACRKPLTRKQHWNRSRFCSISCGLIGRPTSAVSLSVLDVLRANRHTWLTQADIATWVYGDATRLTCSAARQRICWLRQHGHVIAARMAPWETFDMGPRRAYRLIDTVAEVAA